jgi:hypothetical protein
MAVLFFFFAMCVAFPLAGQNNLVPGEQDCQAERPPFDFTIQQAWMSSHLIDARYTPLCGDIDGDGQTEVFAANGRGANKGNEGGDTLHVFEGSTGAHAGYIYCRGLKSYYSVGFALFKPSAAPEDKGCVFIAGVNDTIYLYKVRDQSRPLQFDLVQMRPLSTRIAMGSCSHPVVADLNGDGNVEIITGKYILNGRTLATLATLPIDGLSPGVATGNVFPLVADMDKDGLPEVIVGTDVYTFKTGFPTNSNNPPALWKRCRRYGNTATGGLNMAADINQDGVMDLVLVVSNVGILGPCDITVWTPANAPAPAPAASTAGEIGRFTFSMASPIHPTIGHTVSYPFVGDIDGVVTNGKKYPEICINAVEVLRAFYFDGTNFIEKWHFYHTDDSGATALTLYDFNQDGIEELVYRDEDNLYILHDAGDTVALAAPKMSCGSATIVETPIVADVNGDGSADIIVVGKPYSPNSFPGHVMVFEGAAARWASCPNVWNQQLYSPLLVNRDLTIPQRVWSSDTVLVLPDNTRKQYYNGGPMQAPYISADTYKPVDLSSDVYVVSGSITPLSPTSVRLTVVFGNQGLVKATAGIPIQYYKDGILPANLLGNATLPADLYPGQTVTIQKDLTGLSPLPSRFYVRILDDGVNFPAHGPFSDCNLTNNQKSFGTLELLKTVNNLNACTDGTSLFSIKLINNTNQTASPQPFLQIELTDSLGPGWEFGSATANSGIVGVYNAVTRKITWSVAAVAPGDTAELIISAKALNAGAIRNMAWIESVNGSVMGREVVMAYVSVSSTQAPAPAVITPALDTLSSCSGGSILLSASGGPGGSSDYQWYRNGIEIPGATGSSHTAGQVGKYTVTYFDGTCVSQMSDTAHIVEPPQLNPGKIAASQLIRSGTQPALLTSVALPTGGSGVYTYSWEQNQGDGIWTVISGANAPTYQPPALTQTTLYRRKADEGCTKGYSDTVRIAVYTLPDNIVEATCVGSPPATVWDVELKAQSEKIVHNLATPFVGDINRDGRLEVVVPDNDGYTPTAKRILIFNDSLRLIHQFEPETPMPAYNTMSFLIADVDNDGYGEIVTVCNNGFVYCYAHNSTGGANYKWKSNETIALGGGANPYCPSPIIADVNGDGYAEILVRNKLFDARTGYCLTTLEAGGGEGFSSGGPESFMPVFADIDNDGIQEIAAGNTVYKLTVKSRTDNTQNSAKIHARMTGDGFPDGFTAVADVDLDGDLDVIVTGGAISTANPMFYVWDGDTPVQIGDSHVIPNVGRRISRPFAGNITGDHHPEIAFTYTNKMAAYEYIPASNTFYRLWDKVTTDASGATTMTVFDFNRDGEEEIVYRDQDSLRIINKLGNTVARFFCGSATHTEYPVVVDLDRDGHADIVVSGYLPGDTGGGVRLIRYGSITPGAWTSARSVWNQHGYNAVHVNDDLTIPRYPINPATQFPNGERPYNGFLQQQTLLNSNGDPLWTLPDLKLLNTYFDYDPLADSLRIHVQFTNIGDNSAQAPVYIAVSGDYGSTPVAVALDSLMSDVHPGDTVTKTFTVYQFSSFGAPPALKSLTVLLNSKGLGTPPVQPECEIVGNEQDALSPSLYNDAATVQAYRYTEIDVLGNDSLPAGYPAGTFNLLDSVTMLPRNGTLSVAGAGASSFLIYHNTGTANLTGQIDSFRYTLTWTHPELGTVRRTATVFIYILEDKNDASACSGVAYTVQLRQRPTGVVFHWWQAGDNPSSMPSFQTTPTYALPMPMSPGNPAWQIRPVDPNVHTRWNRTTEGFPAAPFTVHVTDDNASAHMRWTGDVSHDWRNPQNWVEQKITGGATHEYPVDWIPSRCTDVLIPSGMERYPELLTGDSVRCANITLEDRAMLKNPHVLTYDRASVEFIPLAVERDRFLTLSAPLMHMYTGDYHFKNGIEPQWGDVYMHFFRRVNPDTGTPAGVNLFTATFGRVDTMLYLGHAFNLHVVSTSLTRNQGFVFPRTETAYKVNGVNYSVSTRAGAHRFITDEAVLNMTDTTFALPVLDDMTAHSYSAIQVVNPYMAYLDMKKFLDGNSAVLSTAGYYDWDGKESTSFLTVLTSADGVLIPPLRSFFVQKAVTGATLQSVKMSPNWTTTQGRHPYVLRAAEAIPGVLHIHAVMRENSSETTLRYLPDASPSFASQEDLLTLFYDSNPLTLYSFAQTSPEKRPLALNASNDFRTQSVPLGLRLKESGEVTLEFDGLESFENIFLHDRERPHAPVNLKETPYYTFMANKPTFANVLELNDRFTLEMDFKVGSEKIETPAGLRVSGHDGCVRVHATTGIIRHLQIYSISGALLHNDLRAAESYTIPLPNMQTYVVRALVGDRYLTEKVFVK